MQKPLVRIVLAVSLDGRLAMPSGGKASIGDKGDRKALEEALAWADATLIGAETLRVHRNTCLIHATHLIKKRLAENRPEQPIAILVSRQKSHCLSLPFFQQPLERWILSPSIKNEESIPIEGFEKQIPMRKDWSETLWQLSKVGLSRLVVLGGAKLLTSMLIEDAVDELQLTIAPKIIGGGKSWIPIDIQNNLPLQLALPKARNLSQCQKLLNHEVMLSYARNRNQGVA